MALTSAYNHGIKICHSILGNIICQGNMNILIKMALTSAHNHGINICHSILGNIICQGNMDILIKIGFTSAIKSFKIAIYAYLKFKGIPTPIHHLVLENNLEHFPQTRRSHDRNLVKACLLTKLLFCFREN